MNNKLTQQAAARYVAGLKVTDREKAEIGGFIQGFIDENERLKAENIKLHSVVCQTCHGAGSVCSAPDDCYDCPECKASHNKVKADAIRSIKDASWDSRIDGEEYFSASTIDKHADKIEAGE